MQNRKTGEDFQDVESIVPVENGEGVDAFRNVEQRAEHGEDAQRGPEILRGWSDDKAVVELIGRQVHEVDQVHDDIQRTERKHGRHPGAPCSRVTDDVTCP